MEKKKIILYGGALACDILGTYFQSTQATKDLTGLILHTRKDGKQLIIYPDFKMDKWQIRIK